MRRNYYLFRRFFMRVLLFLIMMLVVTSTSYAWERGGVSLNNRSEIKGLSFENKNYKSTSTQISWKQGISGKNYIDSSSNRTFKITDIYDSKETGTITITYPKYLYLKKCKTYFDLKLSITSIYCNMTTAYFSVSKASPGITVNSSAGNWKPNGGTNTSLKVEQSIVTSSNQKKARSLKKTNYYFGFTGLGKNDGIKLYGNYKISGIHRPKNINTSKCEIKKSDGGYTISSLTNSAKASDNKYHSAYFDNSILKSNVKSATSTFRFGNIDGTGKCNTTLRYFAEQPDLNKEKTAAVINKAIAFADKYAKDNSYKYVNYEPDDKKTQLCPVCHPSLQKVKKYKGWNCIGYISACFHHAGVKAVSCRGGGMVNNYFAGYSRITQTSFRKRNGNNWDLVVKQNSKIPASKLKKGDVLLCYSGSTWKHIVMYAGDGYIYDSTGTGSEISKRKYSSSKFPAKVAFRYNAKNVKW